MSKRIFSLLALLTVLGVFVSLVPEVVAQDAPAEATPAAAEGGAASAS